MRCFNTFSSVAAVIALLSLTGCLQVQLAEIDREFAQKDKDQFYGNQWLVPDERVLCTKSFQGRPYATTAEECMSNSPPWAIEAIDKDAQMTRFMAAAKQKQAAEAAADASAARIAQQAADQQAQAQRETAAAQQSVAAIKADRVRREAAMSQQLAANSKKIGSANYASPSTGGLQTSSPGQGAPSQTALSELQSLVSTSGTYDVGVGNPITYYGRIFSISSSGIDYADGNSSSGSENWFHSTAAWADLKGTSVEAIPGEESPSISTEGKSSYAITIAARPGSVHMNGSTQSYITFQIFTADASIPNKVADLLRLLAHGGGSREPSGGSVTVSVSPNALGDDNGANIVQVQNTSTHPIKLLVWTADCVNLEVANCGNMPSGVVQPGRYASFWVNRDNDGQAWSYTVQCTVDGTAACGTSGGGGPAPANSP
jgi:hypothetical protein